MAADPKPVDLATAPAVLLMIEEPGCPYCARWDRDIRKAYEASDEGAIAPLVRRRLGAADITFIKGVVYSPTFVLLASGREVGRILGYQGADLFWMQLSGLIGKAGLTGARTTAAEPGQGAPVAAR